MTDLQVIVPEELREKYPELIDMVMKTESMDDDERQYWIDLLPVMTDEQVQNLYDILDNEKKKLAEIDAFYSRREQDIESDEKAEEIAAQRKARMAELESAEELNESEEKALEDQLLAELENL